MSEASLPRLHSLEEVAEALNETPHYVRDKCRRSLWPHRKGSRGRPSFTDEDYARVLELIAADAQQQDEPRFALAPRSRRAS